MVESVLTYPRVVGEFETIKKVLKGYSIARFGDGEFKMAAGKGYRREEANPLIQAELQAILASPKPKCIVGIPSMDPAGAKYESWMRHHARFSGMVSPKVRYYSAFISRPDSAQWIFTREYAERFQRVWAGKRAVVVSEPDNSLLGVVGMAASEVVHIECPSKGAYLMIDELERKVIEAKADVAILSVGPTATCLANRLSDLVQTIDAGSCGGFLRKMLA
jgi:hypothetical protein